MAVDRFTGRTAWARNLQTPLRTFLRTQTGSAAVLLAATVAALVWVNVDASSYDDLWSTTLSIQRRRPRHLPGPARLDQQRPDDLLLLRHRARGAPRVRHGRAARAAPAGAAGGGGHRRHGGAGRDLPRGRTPASRRLDGWGAAMSTDTAFALGMLALVGPRLPDPPAGLPADRRRRRRPDRPGRDRRRLQRGRRRGGAARGRSACTSRRPPAPRRPAGGRLRPRPRLRRCWGSPAWVALYEAGVEPIVVRPGAWACWPTPTRRPAATWSGRPTASASSASSRRPSWPARRAWSSPRRSRPTSACSRRFLPWTSYVIVPLFALANAGVPIDGEPLRARLHLADHAGDPARLRPGQAGRDRRRHLAGDPRDPRAHAPAGRLGRRGRRRGRSPASASRSRC